MKTELILDTASAVTLIPHQIADESHITATSVQVAKHFKKRHDNVLQRIRTLECSPEFRLLNFQEASYEVTQRNGGTATYTEYRMIRDGFVLVIMNFTGQEAVRWREAYFKTFNAMEKALREHYVEPLIDDKQFRNGIPLKFKLIMQEQGRNLMHLLRAEPDRSKRVNLYWNLFQVNLSLGIPTESIAVLVDQVTPALPRLEGDAL